MNFGGLTGLGGLAAALGPSAAGLLESVANVYSTHETNKTNREIADAANANSARQAQDQMRFQEQMSNTSYQRAMSDMKAAGLNPILAYSQGGASTPSGAQGTLTAARMEAPRVSGLSSSAQAAVQNMMQARRDQSQIALQEAQRNAADATAIRTAEETKRTQVGITNDIAAAKRAAEIHSDTASARQLNRMQSDFDRQYLKYNKYNDLIQKGSRSVEGVIDAASGLIPGGSTFKKFMSRGSSSAKDADTTERARQYLPSVRYEKINGKLHKIDPRTGEIIK